MALNTHSSGLRNLEKAIREAYAFFNPPKDISVSDWAIANRVLPKGTSARPGPFRPEKFQIEMMDAILDPNVHEVVVMKSTQVGYSDGVLNNVVGYFMEIDPKPMMMVQPTIDNARDYGRKRITPMFESTPALKELIRPASGSQRRSGNTLALKEFPGGFLKLTGANSGAGLRSDAVPIILYDEVDAYPLDVDGEGDPMSIGDRRADTFSDSKILRGSTPAKPKGISPIEIAFNESDKRRFHVPCPLCSHMQHLRWRDRSIVNGVEVLGEFRLSYAKDAGGAVIRESVVYICDGCGGKIPEKFKYAMLNAGHWIAEFPGRAIVGFHINALYSPWRENWFDLAKEWDKAQRDPEKLKTFINLRLGETWEEDSDQIGEHALMNRREDYGDCDFPVGVGILTASVDVQNDRLEAVVKGWGDGEESWLIAYEQFFGDPAKPDVWQSIDELLATKYRCASGARLGIRATMIDSGGQHTEEVYKFVKARQHRRIWAIKGSSESGREILGKYSMNNSYRVRLWSLGTDTAKDRIYGRLKIATPGEGYVHFPKWAEQEYFEQLTGEKAIRRYKSGKGNLRIYVKTRPRNEALDMEVYALAALYSLGSQALRDLKNRAKLVAEGIGDAEIVVQAPTERRVRNPGIS